MKKKIYFFMTLIFISLIVFFNCQQPKSSSGGGGGDGDDDDDEVVVEHFALFTKLTAGDAKQYDHFGNSIAVSGNYVVVGAWEEGDGSDNHGAAYVYYKDQGGSDNWGQVKKLYASDGDSYDNFGYSVAIYEDFVLVGAVHNSAPAFCQGAAYIFKRDHGGINNWGWIKKLIASDGEANDSFGNSVAVSDNYAVVGAPGEDGAGGGLGAVYIYYRHQGGLNNWGEQKKIVSNFVENGDSFGTSVAISGDYIIVGAGFEDGTGIDEGAVYVFYKDQGGLNNWGEVTMIKHIDRASYDEFGKSVAISGDYIIVGADRKHGDNQFEGAAYIFNRNQGGSDNWGQIKKLIASDGEAGDHFGMSVSINGDYAIVGAQYEDGTGDFQGAAYIFYKDQGGINNWGEIKKLTANDAADNDHFGMSVVVSGDLVFVGASSKRVIYDNQGEVYIFKK